MMEQVTKRITIGGIETDVLELRTVHDVNQPIGAGTITIEGPPPAHVELAAPIKIEAGYGSDVQTIFDGKIADDVASFGDAGGTVRINIEGHGRRLWTNNHVSQSVAGPVPLHTLFTTFCAERGMPAYFADLATTPGGDVIQLGGNSFVDNGKIVVEANTSPGAVLDRLARLFGYRAFDTPLGVHRFKKISGLPVGTPIRGFVEGESVLNIQKSRTLSGMVNYWEVLGASYTTAGGADVAIRSIPSTLPFDPRLGPTGRNHKELRDEALVTQALADACRNVMEMDASTPQDQWSWSDVGDATLAPGQVVTVDSPKVGGFAALWLMQVVHIVSMQSGWTTSLQGWAGNGVPLPAGNDCVTQALLGSSGLHLGTEYLAHYRRPNPDGLERSIPFLLADGYSNATIRGWAHGTNSFVGNTQSTASRFEIWQGGEEVASGELPRQNENLEQRYPYSQPQYWSPITVPLSGSLDAGSAQLKIISGYDSNVGDYDDFEVRDLTLTTCGVGEPVVVEPGG